MLNARHNLAKSVAADLLPAEQSIDDAIVRNARLAITVVEGRKELRLPLATGQKGLELVSQATASLVQARGLLAEAHMAFRKTQSEIGLDARSYGDMGQCPPPSAEANFGLRIVPTANVA